MHGLKLANMVKNKVGTVEILPRRGTWNNKGDVSRSTANHTAKGTHLAKENVLDTASTIDPAINVLDTARKSDTTSTIDPAQIYVDTAVHADPANKVDTASIIDPAQISVDTVVHVDPAIKVDTASTIDPAINIDTESKLLASFNEASLDEERFLKQKAKVHWLAEGDANTKYFHNTLKCRNHRARIDVITDSNGSLHEGKAVPKAFVDHYVGFLGKEDISIIPITPELFDVRIDQAVAVDMIREFPSLSSISIPFRTNGEDKLCWREGSKLIPFSTSNAWEHIRHKEENVVWAECVWFPQCIPKHAFNMWLICQDDLFLFARGDLSSAKVIMKSLTDFASMSGLSPSNQKSTIFFCNVPVQIKNSILNIMPFVEGKLPVRYLGVPLVASRVRTSDCRALIEKVDNRIGDWKNKLLSFAG
ncbi:hypothetical protein QVD17_00213 [Tagetes erecta]|uniref:Reverse transcriptase zinc-binding domain-containing protein n=1 Tax=Tagetes erecta TaxID=13708 RepID=A0AAD8LB65_TARER|nr:hypothetical protein QVD17_00213 [Tagetes erecta]